MMFCSLYAMVVGNRVCRMGVIRPPKKKRNHISPYDTLLVAIRQNWDCGIGTEQRRNRVKRRQVQRQTRLGRFSKHEIRYVVLSGFPFGSVVAQPLYTFYWLIIGQVRQTLELSITKAAQRGTRGSFIGS